MTPSNKELRAWFAKGKPRWARRQDGSHEYSVGGEPARLLLQFDRPRRGSVAAVRYEPEWRGWTAAFRSSCGEEEIKTGAGEVALFENAAAAMAAVSRNVPRIVRETAYGCAREALATIESELGFYRNLLLPRRRNAALAVLRSWFLAAFGVWR